jgi:hypothetical protein
VTRSAPTSNPARGQRQSRWPMRLGAPVQAALVFTRCALGCPILVCQVAAFAMARQGKPTPMSVNARPAAPRGHRSCARSLAGSRSATFERRPDTSGQAPSRRAYASGQAPSRASVLERTPPAPGLRSKPAAPPASASPARSPSDEDTRRRSGLRHRIRAPARRQPACEDWHGRLRARVPRSAPCTA